MLVHGLGVASTLFLVDTVEQNFVEFLVAHEYDVWLFDWRTSLLLPWACNAQHSLDECAKYDFSVAVDKILEVTGEVRTFNFNILVQVFASKSILNIVKQILHYIIVTLF